MKKFLNHKKIFPSGLPCFYCGVDSTELKYFVFGIIGLLAFSTLMVGVGMWLKGSFKNTEDLSDFSIKAEQRE